MLLWHTILFCISDNQGEVIEQTRHGHSSFLGGSASPRDDGRPRPLEGEGGAIAVPAQERRVQTAPHPLADAGRSLLSPGNETIAREIQISTLTCNMSATDRVGCQPSAPPRSSPSARPHLLERRDPDARPEPEARPLEAGGQGVALLCRSSPQPTESQASGLFVLWFVINLKYTLHSII